MPAEDVNPSVRKEAKEEPIAAPDPLTAGVNSDFIAGDFLQEVIDTQVIQGGRRLEPTPDLVRGVNRALFPTQPRPA